MQTLNSLSGGKSSSYMAVHYPADHEVFSIVCLDNPLLAPKDKKLVQYANDKLEKSGFLSIYGEFIGTPEFDVILKTMMQLEQFIGREITWVRGLSYEQVIELKGGWLPNKLHRYCTVWTKLIPVFEYWLLRIGEPIFERIGFRATEGRRVAKKRKAKFIKSIEYPVSCSVRSKRQKWQEFQYSHLQFPMYTDRIYPEHVQEFWVGKPVVFADLNNCGGCFHRHPLLLNYIYHKYEEQQASLITSG